MIRLLAFVTGIINITGLHHFVSVGSNLSRHLIVISYPVQYCEILDGIAQKILLIDSIQNILKTIQYYEYT